MNTAPKPGDKIYYIDYNWTEWICNFRATKVNKRVWRVSHYFIVQAIDRRDELGEDTKVIAIWDEYLETDHELDRCFTSEQLAQKECDERNKI